MSIKITYKVKDEDLSNSLDNIFNRKTKMMICDDFARLIDPWVPFREGVLSQGIAIGEDFIHYNSPYAHYMHEGIVYGPNIPIKQKDGTIEWRSPKGKKKHPTGKPISYRTDGHPLATAHWERVAMQTQADKFKRDITNIIEASKGNDG